MPSNFIEELRWRGMVHDIMPGTEEALNKKVSSGYIGFDPTADSLHVGHLVQIMTFMLRYMNVITDEMERMKIARQSRGFDATGVKHWKVIATSAAALFIRSYERGERVHLAMLSRGFDGELPHTEVKSVGARAWLIALTIPTFALITSIFVRMIG